MIPVPLEADDDRVDIRITVDATSPPAGVVAVGDRDRSFSGWLQLLSVLESALSGGSDLAGHISGELAPDCTELGQGMGDMGLDRPP